MVEQVYRPRRPRQSPLWQCLSRHLDAFQEIYEERYPPRYGFLRTNLPRRSKRSAKAGHPGGRQQVPGLPFSQVA